MKRLSSILAATAVCAGLASAPLAGAAQLTPQQVAGNAAQSTLAPLEVTPELEQHRCRQTALLRQDRKCSQ